MERAEAADAFEIPDSGRNEMKIDLRQSQLGLWIFKKFIYYYQKFFSTSTSFSFFNCN